MHSTLVARLGLALTLALLPAPVHAQAPAARSGRDLRVPRSIGEFNLRGSEAIDSAAGGGFVLRYMRADSLNADVFVYPGPDLGANCPVECAQRVLTNEGDAFIRSIPLFIARKYMDSATVRTDSQLIARAGADWRLGRRISLDEVRGGAPVWADRYLFYVENVRVKVRATSRREPALSDAIEKLAAATVAALIPTDTTGDRPPD